MSIDPFSPPWWTADLPGIGGRIKMTPEDFEVEEIPAYEPSGSGDHLYLWIEKRDISADYLVSLIARRLGIKHGEIGTAGRKDRNAVTRQWASVPVEAEPRLTQLDGEGIRVLQVTRHNNKLKVGHLQGNRFRILIRDVDPETEQRLPPLLAHIETHGVLNYFGSQRFGHEHKTGTIGLGLLQGRSLKEIVPDEVQKWKQPHHRKFVLSAGQSVLFNLYLGQRLQDGLMRTVLLGDVMGKWPRGGMFVVEDVSREQERFDARETVMQGPIFGRKTFPASGEAAEREETILDRLGIKPEVFHNYGKLLMGTRRQNLVYVDLRAEQVSEGVLCQFSLPAGSYATVLLRELMKTEIEEE